MTSHPKLADLAAKVLRDAPLPPRAAPTKAEEARVQAAIADAIRANGASRARRKQVAAAIAIAASIGAIAIGWHFTRAGGDVRDASAVVAASGAVVVHGPSDAAHLAPGTHVMAKDGPGGLTLGSGTRVSLERGGEMTVLEQGPVQKYALDRGAVRLDVAKLSRGERFIVRTADAEIEVHGTSFRVGTNAAPERCSPAVTTRVEVFEGVVAVRAAGTEVSLHAGDEWPRCEAAAPPPEPQPQPSATTSATMEPAPSAAPVPPVASSAPRPVASAPAAPSASASAPTTLASQNDLFAQAVEASRMGEGGRAISLFNQFLAAYPNSPLAESAMAQRMKLLGRSDAGRAAAREYLARYPSGFARADAEAILAH